MYKILEILEMNEMYEKWSDLSREQHLDCIWVNGRECTDLLATIG